MKLGAFDIDRRVGAGGMGAVWHGWHRATGLEVAVKVVTAASDRARAAFAAEARAVASLDHPHVIDVHDQGIVPDGQSRVGSGAPYLVMAWAGAGTLADEATWTWPDLRAVLFNLLGGLAHAHARGVLHRDIKPGNVVGVGAASGVRWCLADFGIASLADLQRRSGGTPGYTPPEQRERRWRDEGPWTDLYAFGQMVAELTSSLDVQPEGLDDWVAQMCANEPADRFEHAADAACALARIEGGGGFVRRTPRIDSATVSFDGDPVDTRPTSGRRPPRADRDPWGAPPAVPRPPLADCGLGLVGLRPWPMIGRAREQAQLWDALLAVGPGPRVAVVDAVAGAGAARLGDWLCGRASESGLATSLRVGPATTLEAALANRLRLGGLEREAAAARIGLGLGVEPEVARALAAACLDPAADQQRTDRLAALRAALAALAARRPLVVWWDAADEDVNALLTTLPNAPILAIAVGAEVDAERCTLGPLGADDGALLVQALGLDLALAAEVEARAGGLPDFAVEVVRDWAARGRLVSGPYGWTLAGAVDVPADLFALWADRFARLASDVAAALELCAVLGPRVDADRWARACAEAGIACPGAEAAVATGLASWADAHAIAIAPGPRALLLARAGALLPRWHAACARVVDDDEARGRHLLGAGDPACVDVLLQAARRRYKRGDIGHTLDLLRQRETLAATLPLDDPRTAEGWLLEVSIHRVRGDIATAELRANQALDRARAHSGPGWARIEADALTRIARNAQWKGHLEAARTGLADALVRWRALGDTAAIANTLRASVDADILLRRYDEARQHAEEAVALCEIVGDPWELGWALRVFAVAEHRSGRPCRAFLDRAREVARSGSLFALQATVENDIGDLLRREGDLAGAEERFRESARLFVRAADHNGMVPIINLATLLVDRGAHQAALDILRTAAPPRGHVWVAMRIGWDLVAATALVGIGDRVAAREAFARARDAYVGGATFDPDFVPLVDRFGRLAADSPDLVALAHDFAAALAISGSAGSR